MNENIISEKEDLEMNLNFLPNKMSPEHDDIEKNKLNSLIHDQNIINQNNKENEENYNDKNLLGI